MVVVLRSISMLVVVTRVGDKMENGSRLIKEVTTEERASLAAWLLATCVAGTLSISSMMHPLSFSPLRPL